MDEKNTEKRNNKIGKKGLLRALAGFPLGVMIAVIVTLIVSAIKGDGAYHPVPPSMITSYGNELNATIILMIANGFIGAAMSGISVIWNIYSWSLTKQTIIDFILRLTALSIPGYICHWFKLTPKGILIWLGTFCAVYLVIWVLVCFMYYERKKKSFLNMRTITSSHEEK